MGQVSLAVPFLLCLWPCQPATSHPAPVSSPQDKVRQSLEQQPQKREKAAKPVGVRPSALDRFVR